MSNMCCIVNCGSKYPNLGPTKRTLFGFPKDPHENQIWIDKVSLFLRNATRKYLRICDKHFKDSDVKRTFQTVLKDGTINEIPCERFKLNKGSVPCIFDVHQDNFEGESIDIGEESLFVSTPFQDALPTQENEAIEYTIEALKRDLEAPEHSSETIKWGKGLLPDGIILFYCGDSEKYTRKTLVVKKDMSIEVRLRDEIVKLNIADKVHCFQDLSFAMRTLSESHVCSGPDHDTPCTYGFVEASNPNSQRCNLCRVRRRIKMHNERRRAKCFNVKQYKTKKVIKNLKQQNVRMRNYIKKKEETIEELHSRCAALSDRVHILSKTYNKIYDEKKQEMQKHRKQSKLDGGSGKIIRTSVR